MTEVRTEFPDPGVALVTLNRPSARNALSLQVLQELRRAFEDLAGNTEVRAVVLTGVDPAFCAGLDLAELENVGQALLENETIAVLEAFDRPIVGAINGPAITGGLELALLCDIRVASERAVFADTHARVGLVPGWGLTVRLPQAVGWAVAKEMSLSGVTVDANRAVSIGLVNRVVQHERLLSEAVSLAQGIAGGQPATIQAIRAMYDSAAAGTAAAGRANEGARFRSWNASVDLRAAASRGQALVKASRQT